MACERAANASDPEIVEERLVSGLWVLIVHLSLENITRIGMNTLNPTDDPHDTTGDLLAGVPFTYAVSDVLVRAY